MRLIFMGTPDFSVPTLDALVAAGHEVVAVYTQPPRPAGRGKQPRPTPVAARAGALGLPVRTPLNFKEQTDRDALAALDADAAIVVAYGLLLPQAILDAPKRGCFNLHASLLPRWRGAAPIQRAIMAGDAESGVCVMKMALGLDTGPVALTARTPIAADDTAATLHDRLSAIGAPLMVEAMALLAGGGLTLTDQPEDGVYAAKINKAEARIDWSRPAAEVDCHIRGLSPFPGAWFEWNGERIKVLLSERAAGEGTAGEVLDETLSVGCNGEPGDGPERDAEREPEWGAVRLTRLQRAGKAPMAAVDFLRGRPIAKGQML